MCVSTNQTLTYFQYWKKLAYKI